MCLEQRLAELGIRIKIEGLGTLPVQGPTPTVLYEVWPGEHLREGSLAWALGSRHVPVFCHHPECKRLATKQGKWADPTPQYHILPNFFDRTHYASCEEHKYVIEEFSRDQMAAVHQADDRYLLIRAYNAVVRDEHLLYLLEEYRQNPKFVLPKIEAYCEEHLALFKKLVLAHFLPEPRRSPGKSMLSCWARMAACLGVG